MPELPLEPSEEAVEAAARVLLDRPHHHSGGRDWTADTRAALAAAYSVDVPGVKGEVEEVE